MTNQLTPDFLSDVVPPAVPETPCCMCNCKGTLQAILQELRAMRRLMQTQKGQWMNKSTHTLWERNRKRERWKYNVFLSLLASLDRQEQAVSPCQPRLSPGPTPRRRPRKRRPIYKAAPLTVSATRKAALIPLEASPLIAAPAESGKKEESEKKQESCSPSSHPVSSEGSVLPPQNNPVTVNNTHGPLQNQLREPQSLEVICTLMYINTYICALICDLAVLYTLSHGNSTHDLEPNVSIEKKLDSGFYLRSNMYLEDNRNYRWKHTFHFNHVWLHLSFILQ